MHPDSRIYRYTKKKKNKKKKNTKGRKSFFAVCAILGHQEHELKHAFNTLSLY